VEDEAEVEIEAVEVEGEGANEGSMMAAYTPSF
jgi:hypothetical protein